MKFTTQQAASIVLTEAVKETDMVTLRLIIRALNQTVLNSAAAKSGKLQGFKATVIDLKTKSDRFAVLLANQTKDQKAFIETLSMFAGLTEACLRFEDLITMMDTASKIAAENKAKEEMAADGEDTSEVTPTPQTATTPAQRPSGVQTPDGDSTAGSSPQQTAAGSDNSQEEPVNPALQTIEKYLGNDAQKYRSFMKQCLIGTNRLSKDAQTVAFRKVIAATGTKATEVISVQARETIPLQTLKLTIEDYNQLITPLLKVAMKIKAYRTNLGSATVDQLKLALGAPQEPQQARQQPQQ